MINLSTSDWSIKGVRTVLFDKDGTFIDLHYFWGKITELRALELIKRYSLDKNFFDKICLMLGYDVKTQKMLSDGITALYSRSKIIEIFKDNLSDLGVFATINELEMIFDFVSNAFYKDMYKYTKPIDSAIDFIKTVKTYGIKTAIVTSDATESTYLTIKHFGWSDLFDAVVGRESTPYTKESGEPTKMALSLIDADADTAIMVGDAPMDVISAKNAGVENTILVSTGQIKKDELLQCSPYVVDTLDDILFE